MAQTLDTLHVDLSLRGASAVIGDLGKVRAAMAGIGKSLVISNLGEVKSLIGAGGITALIGAGTVKAAADLEQARLGLKRFVDTDFTGLADGIDKLSYRIPIAVSGLYDIASGAAQVGITGTANILAFTTVVGKLATVSSMSFNETAKDLAKLHTVFGLNAGQAPRTANVIAGLSAASAADPGELITTTRYLSGASATIKFTLDQTIALAAAIKDAGISSEVGGTAFNKLILDMAKMPEAFAEINDMSTSEFKKLRDSNPMQALLKSLKSIAGEGSIDDKIAKSEKIGVESVRQSGALLQLIKALELFEEHLGRATKFGDEKKELDKQFNTQAESTYAKLQKLGNAIMQVSDALGGGLSRAVGKAADALTAAALSLKAPPGKVPMGGGAGAPGGQMNIGVPVAPGQFRPMNMGVPGNAKVVPPAGPKADPNAKPTPDQLAEKARADAEKLEAINKELAEAKEKQKQAGQRLAAADTNMSKLRDQALAAEKDQHGTGAQREQTIARIDKKYDAALNESIAAFRANRDANEKVAELEKKQMAMPNPFPKPIIPAAANQDKDVAIGEKTKQGARKFAFDKLVDPQGFNQFQTAFRALPKDLANSDAGKEIGKKLAAMGGADVKKNMSEDELTQLINKRGGAMFAVASAVAQERVQRLYARPTFSGGEETWKRIAAGSAEGSPMERILKENTRLQKETAAATKMVQEAIEKGFAKIENNVVTLVGEP